MVEFIKALASLISSSLGIHEAAYQKSPEGFGSSRKESRDIERRTTPNIEVVGKKLQPSLYPEDASRTLRL